MGTLSDMFYAQVNFDRAKAIHNLAVYESKRPSQSNQVVIDILKKEIAQLNNPHMEYGYIYPCRMEKGAFEQIKDCGKELEEGGCENQYFFYMLGNGTIRRGYYKE